MKKRQAIIVIKILREEIKRIIEFAGDWSIKYPNIVINPGIDRLKDIINGLIKKHKITKKELQKMEGNER